MSRLYIPGEKVDPPETVFFLNDISVCTVGNVSTIFASEGAGKSAAMAAAISAALVPEGHVADCLGWTAEPIGEKCILHFDTEQSKDHRALAMRRAALRATGKGDADVPGSVISVRMHGLSWVECQQLVNYSIEQALDKFPAGIHSIFIDGPGDLVPTVNDEATSNDLINRLMLAAEQHHTHIICVIHLNHGSENDNKMRGHMGSQLARKSETTFQVNVKDDVHTLFTKKSRSKPIRIKDGARFKWSEQFGMFKSEKTINDEEDSKATQDTQDAFSKIFEEAGGGILEAGFICQKLQLEFHCGKSTANNKISEAFTNGMLKRKVHGHYALNPKFQFTKKASNINPFR
jgi:hypothetical protein